MNSIRKEKILALSGFPNSLDGLVPYIKRRNLWIDQSLSIGGEAPKVFLREYIYGRCRRSSSSKWIPFIAKVGQKWYPNESITEQLFTDLGKEFGFKMADSKLRLVGGQLRFMSEYFLKSNQRLRHGAEIFATYLSDLQLVEDIERSRQAREHFTLRFVLKAFESVYPSHYLILFNAFLEMLLYDAITGNNDRHFYNWGVIEEIDGKNEPVFAPIFDTARGLFWNQSEQNLKRKNKSKDFLKKYCESATPKIGVEGTQVESHFDLFDKVCTIYPNETVNLSNKVRIASKLNIGSILDEYYGCLMSDFRKNLIHQALDYRLKRIQSIFTDYGFSI